MKSVVRNLRILHTSRVVTPVRFDFGYGISEIDQKKIFERFYRVSNPKTRNITGTGLGLSIVKRLIDRMGARIEVRSKINQGTVFRIFLQQVPDNIPKSNMIESKAFD